MAERFEEAASEGNSAERPWSTGDPAADWTRYEGQFDRIDKTAANQMLWLLILDGLLLCLLLGLMASGSLTASEALTVTLTFFLPWLGLSASLSVYWAQYRSQEYRRVLQRAWVSCHSSAQPVPYGMKISDSTSLHSVPAVLFGLLSSVLWLVIFVVWLAFVWLSGDQRSERLLGFVQFVGAIVLGLASLWIFFDSRLTHFSSKVSVSDR